MAVPAVQQVLLEYLTTPRTKHINGTVVSDPLDAANPSSVHFGRVLAEPSRLLQVADYTDLHGQAWEYIFFLRQDETGQWTVAGGGGSGGEVTRPHPWVNLAAAWGQFGLWAGGRVCDAGSGVTRVRLIGPEGILLEDIVAAGHALFITDQPVHTPEGITAELFTAAGLLVGRHSAFVAPRAPL